MAEAGDDSPPEDANRAAKPESEAPTQATKEPMPTFAEFLEGVGSSQAVAVVNLWGRKQRYSSMDNALTTPDLLLHCTSEICNGPRIYRYERGDVWFSEKSKSLSTFITYLCSNCQSTRKLYSLHVTREANGEGEAYKYGELPAFGPQTPARLLRLFGKDRDLFLKGRQCEVHGLGIGAFTYYRRVVESHKNQILDEVIRVGEKIAIPSAMLRILQAAKDEIQFSKAMETVKDAIPQALLVNGHNPLTLLHRALSVGVHDLSDVECLQRAHDVRVVLIELAERLGQSLKDEAELNTAINRLLSPR
jgi:hypothetical protein